MRTVTVPVNASYLDCPYLKLFETFTSDLATVTNTF